MEIQKARVIKMVGTNKFVLELIESVSGRFYIVEEVSGKKEFSSPMEDMNLALSLFDVRLLKLEGN